MFRQTIDSPSKLRNELNQKIKWFTLFAQIFCTYPIHYQPFADKSTLSTSNHQNRKNLRKLCLTLSELLIKYGWPLFIQLQIFYLVCDYYLTVNTEFSRMKLMMQLAEDVINVIAALLVIFGSLIQHKYYDIYLSSIVFIDWHIGQIKDDAKDLYMTYQQFGHLIRKLTVTFVGCLMVLWLVMVAVFRFRIDIIWHITIAYSLPHVIISFALLQHLFLLYLLWDRYGQCGALLLVIANDDDEKKGLQRFDGGVLSKETIKKLNVLRRIFFELAQLEVNGAKSFGWFNVIITLQCLVVIGSNLYNLYLSFRGDGDRVIDDVNSVLWIVFLGGRQMMLLLFVEHMDKMVSIN